MREDKTYRKMWLTKKNALAGCVLRNHFNYWSNCAYFNGINVIVEIDVILMLRWLKIFSYWN